MVVESKIALQASFERFDRSIFVDIDVLVLERAPEPFNKDIVQGTTTAIHTYSDSGSFQASRKGVSGELNSL